MKTKLFTLLFMLLAVPLFTGCDNNDDEEVLRTYAARICYPHEYSVEAEILSVPTGEPMKLKEEDGTEFFVNPGLIVLAQSPEIKSHDLKIGDIIVFKILSASTRKGYYTTDQIWNFAADIELLNVIRP